jgi:hypothetical protein
MNIDELSKENLIEYAESLGFVPEWFDDGESILGVAMWVAPDGVYHTLSTLRDAVKTHLDTSQNPAPKGVHNACL